MLFRSALEIATRGRAAARTRPVLQIALPPGTPPTNEACLDLACIKLVMSGHAEAYLWLMARKLVLSGPAAEAVGRLARSAGVSPGELIRRALRREDEAQRGEVEKPVNSAAMGPLASEGADIRSNPAILEEIRANLEQANFVMGDALVSADTFATEPPVMEPSTAAANR